MQEIKKIPTVIVDDHSIVRDGVKLLLKNIEDIEVVGEAGNAEAFFELLNKITPSVVILDISLPTLSGIEITSTLKKERPDIKVLIFSGYIDDDQVLQALEAGADGVIPKNAERDELIEAIYTVNDGGQFLSKAISSFVVRSIIKKNKDVKTTNGGKKVLSDREVEVVKLFSNGFTYKEIAKELHISPRTVESHKLNILEKTGCKTIIDLVKFAIKTKIIEI